jgi:hypothetical protein
VGEIKEPENVIDLEEFQKLNSSFYTNQILDTNSLADNV